jgi:hypothetical protein
MDFEQFTDKFLQWTVEKIEAKKSDGFPVCPYARRARLTNKIQFIDARNNLTNQLEIFDDEKYEIGIGWLGEHVDLTVVQSTLEQLSEKYPDLLYFISTPTSGYFAKNFTNCVFIQLRADILEKRSALHLTTYYNSWPMDYYKDITGSA